MAVKNPFLQVEVDNPSVDSSTFDLSHEVKFSANAGLLYPCMTEEVLPGDTFNHKIDLFARLEPLATPMMQRVNMYAHSFYIPNRILWNDWNDFIRRGDDSETIYDLPYITVRDVASAVRSKYWSDLNPADTTGYKIQGNWAQHNLVRGAIRSLFGVGSIGEYMGLPAITDEMLDLLSSGDWKTQVINFSFEQLSNVKINVLPFKGYIKVWNDYYRDENLQNEIDIVPEASGNCSDWFAKVFLFGDYLTNRGQGLNPMLQPFNSHGMLIRSWEKDYFTGALPFIQKGNPISIPILDGGSTQEADVRFVTNDNQPLLITDNQHIQQGNPQNLLGVNEYPNTGTMTPYVENGSQPPFRWKYDPQGTLKAIIGTDIFTSGIDMTNLKKALTLQWFKERTAQVGNRFRDFVLTQFGVHVPDSRLEEPEYLAGMRTPVLVSEVVQTSGTPNEGSVDYTTPQGTLTGRGVVTGQSNFYSQFFPEHGFVISLFSIRPEASYSQGLGRKWTRRDAYDFALPAFASLGDQDVKAGELYFDWIAGNDEFGTNDETFGYQPRYSEYKFSSNRIIGEFNDTYSDWHMGRRFGAYSQNGALVGRPKLNAEFIMCSDDTNLQPFVYQKNDEDHYLINCFHSLTVNRALPLFSNPRKI